MTRYRIRFTHTATKDVSRLSPKLRKKLREILTEVISRNPYEGKKLIGDLHGSYSYRLTFRDRIRRPLSLFFTNTEHGHEHVFSSSPYEHA